MKKKLWAANDLAGTRDFLAYMILYSPEFPGEDQMTVEKAFEELRHGLEVSGASTDRISEILRDALVAFRDGDRNQGTRLLQEADSLL